MSLGIPLLIVLVVMLVGAFPEGSYSNGWGCVPSGVLSVDPLIVLVLFPFGAILKLSLGYAKGG
ncbi:DUF3309 family protein [Cupriavidus pauculus]|uniref:DUF3309 domain-containing protein n=1 Tax=Cupriavidus pauculus TaxID=82633 RepID=A0A2N5CE42_9BURK|nr:DUF3309 family protein [Cupriavidus pauculus]PLQ00478.1 DUF3309 domain-containing protein [Cupriavidus pauculus]